jgi:hypothetical protein
MGNGLTGCKAARGAQYRNGSLWALLDAVLRHPKPDWVKSWVPVLGEAVLAPIRGEFQEALEFAALGQRSLLGDASAIAELDERTDTALEATEDMHTANTRAQGDVWGTQRRRLAALAETLVRIPDRQAKAAEMIGRALKIKFGFAGFSAPAALRLAESVRITTPGDASAIERALNAAVTSAHNINDPTLCARTTARVNAIRENWWTLLPSGVSDLRSAAQRLLKDSATVAVGTRVTPRPPHRSRRAALPHRALTLSYGVQRSVLRARDVGLWVVEANG